MESSLRKCTKNHRQDDCESVDDVSVTTGEHYSRMHQMTRTIKTRSGSNVTLQRATDGLFHCHVEKCGYTEQNAAKSMAHQCPVVADVQGMNIDGSGGHLPPFGRPGEDTSGHATDERDAAGHITTNIPSGHPIQQPVPLLAPIPPSPPVVPARADLGSINRPFVYRPSVSQLYRSAQLDIYSLVINITHRVLICTLCRQCVPWSEAHTHVANGTIKAHINKLPNVPRPNINRDVMQAKKEVFPEGGVFRAFDSPHNFAAADHVRQQEYPPVAGIIVYMSGVQCQSCFKCSLDRTAFEPARHSQCVRAQLVHDIPVQRTRLANNSPLFRVTLPVIAPALTIPDFTSKRLDEKYSRAVQAINTASMAAENGMDRSHTVDVVYQTLDLYEYFNGAKMVVRRWVQQPLFAVDPDGERITLPPDTPTARLIAALSCVRKETVTMFELLVDCAQESAIAVRKLLMCTVRSGEDPSNRTFRRLQEAPSRLRYANHLASFVCFVLAVSQARVVTRTSTSPPLLLDHLPPIPWQIPLSNATHEAATKLIDLLCYSEQGEDEPIPDSVYEEEAGSTVIGKRKRGSGKRLDDNETGQAQAGDPDVYGLGEMDADVGDDDDDDGSDGIGGGLDQETGDIWTVRPHIDAMLGHTTDTD